MRSCRSFLLCLVATAGMLAGCSDYEHRERPPWRAEAERVCLAKGLVHESASIRAAREMNGPGVCGAIHPFKVTALAEGSVTLNATQTLDCPMIAALDLWVREVVQPAAQARFGEPVVRIDSMGSYACRGINNMSGASLSEHAFANAIDIGGFVLASGRDLNVMRGFNGPDEQERAFLHEVHAGACEHFTTVLGPGYNVFHYNHFHMDLAMHGMTSRGSRRYCKPVPRSNLPGPPAKDNLPDPPPIDEEMDIARAPLPAPELRSGPPALLASVPTPVAMRTAAEPRRPAALAERAATPPARPARALAAEPKIAGGDAPLISFAEPDLSRSPLMTSRPPGLRHDAPADPQTSSGSAEPRAPGRDASASPSPRRRAPPGADASPRDWDITSSIDR